MLPEHLRTFVRKPPAGARLLVIVTETTLGVGPPVAEWTREQLEVEDGAEKVAAEVASTCQEFADSEGALCKFLLRWIGSAHERPLSSRVHRVTPTANDTPSPNDKAGQPLSELMVRELLGHISKQQRQLNEALPSITASFKDTLNTLTELLKDSHKREAEWAQQARQLPAPAAPRELTAEEREESIQRAEALKSFTGKLPEIIDLGITLAAAKFLPADASKPEKH